MPHLCIINHGSKPFTGETHKFQPAVEIAAAPTCYDISGPSLGGLIPESSG